MYPAIVKKCDCQLVSDRIKRRGEPSPLNTPVCREQEDPRFAFWVVSKERFESPRPEIVRDVVHRLRLVQQNIERLLALS